jgi:hypothetical protein
MLRWKFIQRPVNRTVGMRRTIQKSTLITLLELLCGGWMGIRSSAVMDLK